MPNGGGNLWMGVNTDALSWTADSQHVAFTWENTVRLLDTRAAGSDILTDSKTVATWTGGVQGLNQWRGAIITPDGRTVLGIEQRAGINLKGPIREHLVSWSAATGQQIAVLNNLNARKLVIYEQILYTSADGRLLVLTYQRPGAKAAIVHDGRSTPIPWSPYIGRRPEEHRGKALADPTPAGPSAASWYVTGFPKIIQSDAGVCGQFGFAEDG